MTVAVGKRRQFYGVPGDEGGEVIVKATILVDGHGMRLVFYPDKGARMEIAYLLNGGRSGDYISIFERKDGAVWRLATFRPADIDHILLTYATGRSRLLHWRDPQ